MINLLRAFILGMALVLAATPIGLAQTKISAETDDFSQITSLSPSGFTVSDYKELKARDPETAQLVLVAIFYAQKSVGKPVLCASPVPISGSQLMAMFDNEIAAPTNPGKRPYGDLDHAAFVLMFALRSEGACQ
jgi:hypothetical protein